MDVLRLDVQNSSLTVACESAGLFYKQCQGRALI